MPETSGRRKLRVERKVYGAPATRPMTVVRKRPRDFPGVSRDHIAVARLLEGHLMGGPPLCTELVTLVEHLFTEEEASLVRHLSGVRPKSARVVARAARRPGEEVRAELDRMGYEKFVIEGLGHGDSRTYRLPPVMGVPGIFEYSLMGQDLETMSPWHRRAAELFEALFETGWVGGKGGIGGIPVLRSLPAAETLVAQSAALPSDKLEVVLDRFDTFSVGNCQCRMSRRVVGKGCDKPLRNCMSMGAIAKKMIRLGQQQEVSKKEALEIKLEAERHGLVTWIVNTDAATSQGSCSCCGCCCAAMRSINEFSAPSMFAPPHFQPSFDWSKCTYCGKCAASCALGALVVDAKQKDAWHLAERCVGCGLCSLSCDKQRAITMEPVPDYRVPPQSWFATIASVGPSTLENVTRRYIDRSPLVTWWRK